MTVYFSNDFYVGLKIIFNDKPHVIEYNQFVKPGKGQAFSRVKMRNLITKKLIEKTLKSIDSFKSANILDITVTYLYNNTKNWFFFNKETFDQISIEKEIVGKSKIWLIKQNDCCVTLWNNSPISITPNKFVYLKIVNTNSVFKNNTISSNSKLATLSNGVIIKVPSFIENGHIIKVNTISEEYVSRMK
ncbi:Elongation factor P [Buchnera aphidicola (Neophyllaphis podocarpi)]|uniref:elongation factor P n=1 Tax=Buchnera aphidicola TaxID=9 RepID=UPI0031B873CE